MVYRTYLVSFFLQTLLSDITAYRTQLDQVRELGQQLIVTSGHLPQLVQQTESQLTNMDDSYASLTATATQIKVRVMFNVTLRSSRPHKLSHRIY